MVTRELSYLSSSAVVVGYGALVVCPEGVKEAVVGTSAGGSGPRDESTGLIALLGLEDEVEWRGKRCGSTAESEQDGREGDHVD